MPHEPMRTVPPTDPVTTKAHTDTNDPATTKLRSDDDGRPTPLTLPPNSADRYDLGAEIARGGMGVIHRATDTVLGREIAIKVLQERFGPASAANRRFIEEARITAQLQHPAIPPVHDLGTLPDGRPFLAMKLIKGQTLDNLLKQRPDPAHDRGRFVAAFEQVCQALAFAHARKVIHRDLKPANVMVGNFGEVQVMDWGLAKVLGTDPTATADPDQTSGGTEIVSLRESDGEFTQAGSVLGTPAFMPPEQAVGAVGKVDMRSDVFGLGAILAVILTGQPPFAGASAETTRVKAAQGRVKDCFEQLDACGADPELIALCKRCLAPDKEDRPADAGAVAALVGEYRAGVELRLRQAERDRATAEAKAAEEQKRRRVLLFLATAVAALFVVTAAGVSLILWQKGLTERAQLREQAQRSEAEEARLREAAAVQKAAFLRESSLHNAGVALYTTATFRLIGRRDDPAMRDRSEQELRRAVTSLDQAHREFPGHPEHGYFLGLAYLSLADASMAKGTRPDIEAGLGHLDRAERLFVAIRDAAPRGAPDPFLSLSENAALASGPLPTIGFFRYVAYLNLQRYSEALEELDRVHPEAVAATPLVPPGGDVVLPPASGASAKVTEINHRLMYLAKDPRENDNGETVMEDLLFIRSLLLRAAEMEQSRMPWSRGSGTDRAKAMRLSAHLAETRGVAEAAIYNAACVFSLASVAPDIDAAERERRAARAVVYLERIRANGYFRHPQKGKQYRDELATDTDLDPLRGREDFRRVFTAAQQVRELAPPPRAVTR